MTLRLRAAVTVLAVACLSLVPPSAAVAVAVPGFERAHVAVGDVTGEVTVALPFAADYAVLTWAGSEEAAPSVSWSTDGTTFGPWRPVGHDELLADPAAGRAASAVLPARDATAVRVRAAAPLRAARLDLLDSVVRREVRLVTAAPAAAAVDQPPVVTRAQWGANEDYRPNPPTFAPVQKLVVHHTGVNDPEIDSDPAGYVRAIQSFHVTSAGYADIGYQFLIDRQGRVYEGRYARDYAPGETPTGENAEGEAVIGAHVAGTNTGLVGIAMLGDLTDRQPTAAQRDALVAMLAWESQRHGIDPVGAAPYVGPSGTRTFANISGHRDAALPDNPTACPGDAFHPTLPQLRLDVAALAYGGQLVPVSPRRLADTRATAAVGPGKSVTVPVRGVAPVPAGARAAVLNVTAVGGTAASSYLTVYPAGAARPLASTLNFRAGSIVPNLTMSRLGANGAVSVFNASGSVHVLVDLVGWYVDGVSTPPPGAAEMATLPAPVRLLDTRTTSGGGAVRAGDAGSRALAVRGRDGIPATATAVVLNVTVDKPTASGYLTVYPDGEARPTVSNLNFVRGQTVPNLVVVKVGAGGSVRLFVNSGAAHVVVDAVGWFEPGEPGARFVDLVPARVLDTRGGAADGFTAAVGPGQTISVPVRGRGGVPASAQAAAVVLNVTVTQPTESGFLTVWPSDVPQPGASNLNFGVGQTIANLVVARVGTDGRVKVFNPRGYAHVLFDVVGWYHTG